jgi:hypothetical protein
MPGGVFQARLVVFHRVAWPCRARPVEMHAGLLAVHSLKGSEAAVPQNPLRRHL